MKEDNPSLIHTFFYKVLCFLIIYENEKDKWKIKPELNTIIKELFSITKKIENHDSDFENMILDLQTTLDSGGMFDNFLVNYKDFILKYSN